MNPVQGSLAEQSNAVLKFIDNSHITVIGHCHSVVLHDEQLRSSPPRHCLVAACDTLDVQNRELFNTDEGI